MAGVLSFSAESPDVQTMSDSCQAAGQAHTVQGGLLEAAWRSVCAGRKKPPSLDPSRVVW